MKTLIRVRQGKNELIKLNCDGEWLQVYSIGLKDNQDRIKIHVGFRDEPNSGVILEFDSSIFYDILSINKTYKPFRGTVVITCDLSSNVKIKVTSSKEIAQLRS